MFSFNTKSNRCNPDNRLTRIQKKHIPNGIKNGSELVFTNPYNKLECIHCNYDVQNTGIINLDVKNEEDYSISCTNNDSFPTDKLNIKTNAIFIKKNENLIPILFSKGGKYRKHRKTKSKRKPKNKRKTKSR